MDTSMDEFLAKYPHLSALVLDSLPDPRVTNDIARAMHRENSPAFQAWGEWATAYGASVYGIRRNADGYDAALGNYVKSATAENLAALDARWQATEVHVGKARQAILAMVELFRQHLDADMRERFDQYRARLQRNPNDDLGPFRERTTAPYNNSRFLARAEVDMEKIARDFHSGPRPLGIHDRRLGRLKYYGGALRQRRWPFASFSI